MLEFEPLFEEDTPLFTLVCGCEGHKQWSMDLTWEVVVVQCRGHIELHLPDLPPCTELVDVHWDHWCHTNKLWNE